MLRVCVNQKAPGNVLGAHIGGSAPNGVLCVCVAHTSAELLPLGAAADSSSAQFAFSRTITCNNKQNKKKRASFRAEANSSNARACYG